MSSLAHMENVAVKSEHLTKRKKSLSHRLSRNNRRPTEASHVRSRRSDPTPSPSPKKKGVAHTPTHQQQRDALWQEALAFYEKASRYDENDECEGAYCNYLLCGMALHQCIQCESPRSTTTTRPAPKAPKAPKRTTDPATASSESMNRHDLHGTLLHITACITLFQEKVAARQALLGCPEEKGGGSDDDDQDDLEDCSGVVAEKVSPDISFDSIIGNKSAKDTIQMNVLKPIQYPNLFPLQSSNFLFYGPPGTGKTLMAKAIATQLTDPRLKMKSLFFAPLMGDLKGKFVGESEKNIVQLFKCASRKACEEQARLNEDDATKGTTVVAIIFLDEIDTLTKCKSRDSSVSNVNTTNTLLQMINGVESLDNVITVAATNHPEELDSAIKRRFAEHIGIWLPSPADFKQMVQFHFAHRLMSTLTTVTSCDNWWYKWKNPLGELSESPQQWADGYFANQWYTRWFELWQPILGVTLLDMDKLVGEIENRYKSVTPSGYGLSGAEIENMCTKVLKKGAHEAQRSALFYRIRVTQEEVNAYLKHVCAKEGAGPDCAESKRNVLLLTWLDNCTVSSKTYNQIENMFSRETLSLFFAAVANARPEYPPSALPPHYEVVEVNGRKYHYAATARLNVRKCDRKIPETWTSALNLLQKVSIGNRENETYMYVDLDCKHATENIHFAMTKQAITKEDNTIQIVVVGDVPATLVKETSSYASYVKYTVSSPGWWMQQLNDLGAKYQVYFRFGNSVTYCFEPPQGSMNETNRLGVGANWIGSYTLDADVSQVAIKEPSEPDDYDYACEIYNYWFGKKVLPTGEKVDEDVLQLHQYTPSTAHDDEKDGHPGDNQFVNLTFDPEYFRKLCVGKQPEITPACKPEEWQQLKKL